jgi:hypothetical protein
MYYYYNFSVMNYSIVIIQNSQKDIGIYKRNFTPTLGSNWQSNIFSVHWALIHRLKESVVTF